MLHSSPMDQLTGMHGVLNLRVILMHFDSLKHNVLQLMKSQFLMREKNVFPQKINDMAR